MNARMNLAARIFFCLPALRYSAPIILDQDTKESRPGLQNENKINHDSKRDE